MSDPYKILGVAKNATDAEIKKAYHKLVMQHHPDRNQGNKEAEEKFKEINNAFDILKDPQKRSAYDRYGESAFAGGNGASAGSGGFNGNPFGGGGGFGFDFGGMGGADMQDMMDEVLRGFGINTGRNGRAQGRSSAGRDLLHEIEIDLKTAYFGKTETIKFSTAVKCDKCDGHGTSDGKTAPVCETCGGSGSVMSRRGIFVNESTCPDCHGMGRIIKKKCSECNGYGVVNKNRTLDVEIPAGVQDGTRIRIHGQGEAAPFGGKSGDFYIDVRVRQDKKFERDGANLIMNAEVPFATLALGGEIEIETIAGKKLDVKIPSGTQVGENLRIRDRGMPTGRGGDFGDLYINISTIVPTKLSKAQKKALEDFNKA